MEGDAMVWPGLGGVWVLAPRMGKAGMLEVRSDDTGEVLASLFVSSDSVFDMSDSYLVVANERAANVYFLNEYLGFVRQICYPETITSVSVDDRGRVTAAHHDRVIRPCAM